MRFSRVGQAKNIERSINDYSYFNQKQVIECANSNWKSILSQKLMIQIIGERK